LFVLFLPHIPGAPKSEGLCFQSELLHSGKEPMSAREERGKQKPGSCRTQELARSRAPGRGAAKTRRNSKPQRNALGIGVSFGETRARMSLKVGAQMMRSKRSRVTAAPCLRFVPHVLARHDRSKKPVRLRPTGKRDGQRTIALQKDVARASEYRRGRTGLPTSSAQEISRTISELA